MPRPNDREGLRLSPQTQERLRELLDGRTCCRCGAPAERLSADRYFCGAHFWQRRETEASLPKVYRCLGGTGS